MQQKFLQQAHADLPVYLTDVYRDFQKTRHATVSSPADALRRDSPQLPAAAAARGLHGGGRVPRRIYSCISL